MGKTIRLKRDCQLNPESGGMRKITVVSLREGLKRSQKIPKAVC